MSNVAWLKDYRPNRNLVLEDGEARGSARASAPPDPPRHCTSADAVPLFVISSASLQHAEHVKTSSPVPLEQPTGGAETGEVIQELVSAFAHFARNVPNGLGKAECPTTGPDYCFFRWSWTGWAWWLCNRPKPAKKRCPIGSGTLTMA